MKYFVLLCALLLSCLPCRGQSSLRASATKIDITPEVGTPLAGFGDRTAGSTGVRDPLRAGILLLDDGETMAAVVTLDLINVGDEETRLLREEVASRTGIAPPNILVAASHTHGGPPFDSETGYARDVASRIGSAAAALLDTMQPITIGVGSSEMDVCVNRRLVNSEGIAEMRPNPRGPVDNRVRVLRLDGASGDPAAVIIHVACHANVFRSTNLEITADYPGFVQSFVEDAFGAPALFLAGAGADIRPNLPSEDGFRSGDERDLKWVGLDIGSAAVTATNRLVRSERIGSYRIRVASGAADLPLKDSGAATVSFQALRIGSVLFVTIPGEPFLAFQRHLEEAFPDLKVFVVGYSNGHHGYICTSDSYRFGGYEPGVSRFAPEAEHILVKALIATAAETL